MSDAKLEQNTGELKHRLRVLALEPYYGGSHQAFLDTWKSASRHEWTCLTLPAHHWKWRMRHASVTLAEQAEDLHRQGQTWDVVFCSDMLSLAEWKGLAPSLANTPCVAYFHENQLTYPVRHHDQRDLHFAMTNLTTMLAADQAWFNSEFHRNDFCTAAMAWLERMPDYAPLVTAERLAAVGQVQSPGCPKIQRRTDPLVPTEDAGGEGPVPSRIGEPLHIAWAARWEFDKGPATFAAAIERLLDDDARFVVSVMGQVFNEIPPSLRDLHGRLLESGRLRSWGWQSRQDYRQTLQSCDVFVSTAEHEFFGMAVLEAIAWGAVPLLPQRLSYPELLRKAEAPERFFYDGSVEALATCLKQAIEHVNDDEASNPTACWQTRRDAAQHAIASYTWTRRVPALDDGLALVAKNCKRRRIS